MAAITFSGLASGIDTTSLIKSLLDTERKVKVQPFSTKIDALTATNDAFSKLKSLVEDLDTVAQEFRALNNGPLVRGATSSNDARVSAVASGSAAIGSYNIDVLALAKNATLSFGTSFASTTSLVSGSLAGSTLDRTVSFQVGTGAEAENVDVVLDSTSTLDSFVSQFNSQSSKATASIIRVANGDYRLAINSSATGLEDGSITLTSLGAAYTSAGVLTTNSLSQATDAEFLIDGLGASTIVRSTNSVADVISGLTLNLQSLGSATVTVATDAEQSSSRVSAFVDAYNEIQAYIAENDLVARDESAAEVSIIYGTLSQSTVDNNLLSALKSAFSLASSSSGSVRILADLGITTQRDGSLAFDQETFLEALEDNPTETETLLSNLGERLSAVDGTIAQFSRFAGILDTTINTNKETITAYTNRITDAEAQLAKKEQSLVLQYSRLESLMSKLNSQQASLASLLPG